MRFVISYFYSFSRDCEAIEQYVFGLISSIRLQK